MTRRGVTIPQNSNLGAGVLLDATEIRIDADLLIPGRGDPMEDGAVIFSTNETAGGTGKIIYAGSQSDIPSEYHELRANAKVPVVMPGLWDCHVHFFGEAEPSLDQIAFLPQPLAGARSARDIAATLNAGYTSVREVGGYGVELSKAINEGWLPGPNIYSAVSPISQTAGHGDLHSIPLELLHDRINHGLPLHLCDGVDECIKAVRIQIRRGAKLIKVCATGGVMSRIDSPLAAQFTPKELSAMVEEATRTNMIVAAHCHGTEGIIAALNAGVKTIEHGSFLTKEAIDLMLEKKAMLIATRFIQVNSLHNPGNLPEESYKKLLQVEGENKKSYAAAVKAGVKCALGTDLGMSSVESHFNHGMNGHEFGFAIEAGMTALEAIEAGTANGPDTLGPQAPLSGQLKKDYDADLIILSANPLEDISILADPQSVTHVWKAGKLFKAPGKPISFF